jgi:uncharacterized repeat protein (TIGR02543 family)
VLAHASLLLLAAVVPQRLHAQAAATIFGTPSNFDVLNDAGQDVHGFDIEIDGVSPADLAGVWSFSRYPHVVLSIPGGIVIHYTSPYVGNQYQITTIAPATFTPTLGHSCVQGAILGCEHFGYYFNYNAPQPTNVVHRWLVNDPQNPGNLIPYAGPSAQVPLPKVGILPPPQPGQQPVVVFQIPVPPPPPPPVPRPELQFGEAKWVKVLKNDAQQAVVVDQLLEDDPVVPNDGNPAQVEIGWKLLQFNPHSPSSGVLTNQAQLGQGSKAVIRKYEFYKYSGVYDAATHAAICGGDGTCTVPQPGELGDFIGNQMAAANVGVPSLTVARTGPGTVTGASGKINCGGSCTTNLALGTSVTLTAIPPSNAVFTGWSGACAGTDLTCTFSITGENTVTANFVQIFTLSVGRSGSGTVTGTPSGTDRALNCGSACSAKFLQGSSVTLTATPSAGLSFVGWSGSCSGTAPVCNVAITKDTTVQANFK